MADATSAHLRLWPQSTAAYIVRKPDGTAKVGIALDDDKSKSVTTVIRITPGGLAAAAGIPIGAVILSVNGEVVTGMEQGAALIKAAVRRGHFGAASTSCNTATTSCAQLRKARRLGKGWYCAGTI